MKPTKSFGKKISKLGEIYNEVGNNTESANLLRWPGYQPDHYDRQLLVGISRAILLHSDGLL